MTGIPKNRSAVDRAASLFEREDWEALAALSVGGDVSEADDAQLNDRVSAGENPGPWRRWATSRDVGSALLEIGTVLLNEGRNAPALEVLRRAEELGATSDRLVGEALARAGAWDAALPRLQRVLAAREPQWENAAYRLAEHAFDIENRMDDDVLELAGLVIDRVPGAVILSAEILRRRGDVDAARHLLEDHRESNKLVPRALGDLLSDAFGDHEGAENAYIAAVEKGDTDAAYRLGSMLAGVDGRAAESEAWLRRAADDGAVLARFVVDEIDRVAGGSSVRMVEATVEDFDRPTWVHERYAPDLVPYIHALPWPEPSLEPIFSIDDELPLPLPGQLARAGREGLRVEVWATEQEFDLSTVASAIPELVDLTIGDGARVTGLTELENARSLRDLNVRIRGTEPVDLSALPMLGSAQVMGQHFLSVCRNPNVRVLSLELTRASLRPVIDAPVHSLHLTARHAGELLDGVRHPEEVRRLSLWKARDVDLSVLANFPNLEHVSLYWCNGITGAESLVGRTFREVEVYRCRNIEGSIALRALQARAGAGEPEEPTVGPFVVSIDDEDGTADLSTSAVGWDGIARPFADKILSFSGYQMERLVVAIAKDRGLWSRSVVRDSELEAMHLVFRDAASATAIAEAAWAVLQDSERLGAFLSTRTRT
jgi:tetratricopeptide (TPR) repeat protein